jgi:hypothetical protein
MPSKFLFLSGAGGNPSFWEPVSELLMHLALKIRLGWSGFGSMPTDPLVNNIDDLVANVIAETDQPTAIIAQSMVNFKNQTDTYNQLNLFDF